MALNPRGTRQRDGAAQLSQFRSEWRLFDATSTSNISAVIEVWNEPVVIHIHDIAPGQAVAVDCVSDYDSGAPVYTPFTPTRSTPLILDEDLTSVILFYSGRYVLRLTGGGLGTVKAFAYPFSVSHDWGDYYASLGTGGNVVRQLTVVDTNTIDLDVNPDPGIGNVVLTANAILSPDQYNILMFQPNGMFVRGPDNGILNNVPTSVADTTSIDMTLAANVLSAVAIISPNPGNGLSILANGLYVAGFSGTITDAADTNTIDHTVTVGILTSQVIKSPDAGNLLELRVNGLWTGVDGAATSVVDTQSINLTLAANILQADLVIDPRAEPALNLSGAGVLVEQATTAEEEAETAGDLVINAATLGHIVNARTATQSSHLGVGAGSLALGQVSIGYATGTGVTGADCIAIGRASGIGVTGTGNIAIGTTTANTVIGNDNIHIGNINVNGVNDSQGVFIGSQQGAVFPGVSGNIAIGYEVLNGSSNTRAHAIGYQALKNANLLGGAVTGNATVFGSSAGGGLINNNAPTNSPVEATLIGGSAGYNARSVTITAIGAYAGFELTKSNALAANGVHIGSRASASSFILNLGGAETYKNIVAVGDYALNAANAFTGAAVDPPSLPVDLGDTYVAIGPYAGYSSEGTDSLMVGAQASVAAAVLNSCTIGAQATVRSVVENSVILGNFSGSECTHIQNTIIGKGAYTGEFIGAALVTFTDAAINTVTNVFTTGVHGLTVGTYLSLRYNVTAGTGILPLNDGSSYVFYVLSPTTLRLACFSPANVLFTTPSTLTLKLQSNKYSNVTVLGYSSTATASNQVTLGNDQITSTRTAGKIYPGDDSGGFQTTAGIYGGAGAPNNANGSNGDFYLRSDGAALTYIYVKTGGAWVGIA